MNETGEISALRRMVAEGEPREQFVSQGLDSSSTDAKHQIKRIRGLSSQGKFLFLINSVETLLLSLIL